MKLVQRYGSGIACIPHEDELESKEPPDYSMDDGLRERIHRRIWRTATGDDIPITEMENIHLMRTINLIKRKAHHDHPATKEYIRLMQTELHRRDPNTFAPHSPQTSSKT